MNTRYGELLICYLILLVEVRIAGCSIWDRIRCASDSDIDIPDGKAELGRFPWLGIVQQDNFYVGATKRYIVTGGILIHPTYAIAPAHDVSRIIAVQFRNKAQFVLWRGDGSRYALDVTDYIFHPDYKEQRTFATLALLGIARDASVLPVCVPTSGVGAEGGSFSNIYAVKLTDEHGEFRKYVYKMKYVNERECNDFYYVNKLMYSKMTPVQSTCFKAERNMAPCVWDGGAALITRQPQGFWKLIGFSVRGPGCGAPARFLVITDYMSWINYVLSEFIMDYASEEQQFNMRTLSSIETNDSNETLNIKPLSKDKEWSPDAPSGVGATGVAGSYRQGPASDGAAMPLASSSSEERAIRRVMGRWGAEWLS